MRIALVHYSAPPVIGGVERVLAQQAKLLKNHGHEVIVVCGNSDAKVDGAEVHIAGREEPCSSSRKPTDHQVSDIKEHLGFVNFGNPIHVHRPKRLPHWQQGGTFYFVTWRLNDAIPEQLLKNYRAEKLAWLQHHPKPWDPKIEDEYYRRFGAKVDGWLDAGAGSCVLRNHRVSQIMVEKLQHYNGDRYVLDCFVIMPNHVHVVFWMPQGEQLERVVQGWKGFSALSINKSLGREGALWQEGYWDRLVRSEEHLAKIRDYVRNNPVKAKLTEGEYIAWEREQNWWKGDVKAAIESGDVRGGARLPPPCEWLNALKDCDVVIVHNMLTMPFQWEASRALAVCSREMPGTRFINWVHDVDVSPEAFAALELKARHVAVSKVRQREFCKTLKIPLKQCRVVPNGVEVSTVTAPTPGMAAFALKHRFKERACVLLHPTRVLARKNIELGIEITAALRARGVDVLYVVTGAIDPHRKESAAYATLIHDLVVKHALQEAVLFVSSECKVEDVDVQSLYLLADALLFPSKKEGFGLPLIEASLHRLPVFCSDIPIHREVMGRTAHYLDLQAAPAELAEFIVDRLPRKPSWKTAQKLQDRYSWEMIYQDYLEPLLNEG